MSPPPQIIFKGDGTVTLVGWREWSAELYSIFPLLERDFAWRHNELVKLIKARAIEEAATDREKKVARSLSTSSSKASAKITIRPTLRLPDAFGREFGAKHDVFRKQRAWWRRDAKPGAEAGMKGWNQFAPWRGNQWEQPAGNEMGGPPPGVGYFLWPAIRKSRPDISQMYEDAIEFAIERSRAFPDPI